MTQLYRTCVVFLGLLCCVQLTFGQTPSGKTISGDFSNLRFEQFVQRIETQTPYRFFYNPADADSITVDIRVENQPVRSVLQQLFKDTKYSFAIDNQQHVYITTTRPIRTELPIGFFVRGRSDSGIDSTFLTESQTKRVEPEANVYEIGKRTIRSGRGDLRCRAMCEIAPPANRLWGQPFIWTIRAWAPFPISLVFTLSHYPADGTI